METPFRHCCHYSESFFSYVLSFVYLGIYWNNHHHMLHSVELVTGQIMWANLHLLFWLSLIPFATGWMGENRFAPAPTALYGTVLLMASIAYMVLQKRIIASQGNDSALGKAVAKDWKGKVSIGIYAVSIVIALEFHWFALGIYVFVAVLWLVPDRRAERALLWMIKPTGIHDRNPKPKRRAGALVSR